LLGRAAIPTGHGYQERALEMGSTAARQKAASLMSDFSVGQKWVIADPIFGIFYGEVAEVSDDSQSGTVVITDGEGNELDTFVGSAVAFRVSGEWRLVGQELLRYRKRRAGSTIPRTRPGTLISKAGQRATGPRLLRVEC
jgi:hypothetical protein